VVLGNSSSGLYEAPSFGIPTIDVGDRQEGRIRAASVLHVPPTAAAIRAALDRAPTLDCSAVRNPYDLGGATERIVAILQEAM
jgi:UDP-N-acetylglucosamine 2-epimerase